MEVKEFQKLALRTESIVDEVKVNKQLFLTVLGLIASLNDVLDAMKKSIYYNDDKKLKEYKENKNYAFTIEAGVSLLLDGLNRYDSKSEIDIDSRVLHGIMGMSTESGELIEALIKSINENKPIDATNVSEEMHDSSWYMAVLHDALNLVWNDGLENVINKLKIRFPDKFTNENAANRDLDSERKALEGKV